MLVNAYCVFCIFLKKKATKAIKIKSTEKCNVLKDSIIWRNFTYPEHIQKHIWAQEERDTDIASRKVLEVKTGFC